MADNMIKNEKARIRLENWYQRFLNRVKAPAESRILDTSFGPAHLLFAGDRTKPPLVCLHSMMTSSAHLLSEMEPLLDRFQIIAPDIPGQSVKGLPRRLSYTDASHANWLKEILDELNLQKVNLFGVSLGGFAARQYSSMNPERVSRLILLVPAGIVQGPVIKGLLSMALPMMMYKINPIEKNLRKLTDFLLTTWDEDWANYLGDAFNDFTIHKKIPPAASDDELKKLTMPCLIIAADEDISFPGGPLIKRMASQVPNAETELLTNSRHSPPITDEFRNWLADRITAFIHQ
jgi:2-hydroxy-6-oxonona-2,4-dienedioate hydrolase